LILSEIEHNDFVRRASSADIKLYGLANSLVFLLDALVIGNNVERVLEMFSVNLPEGNLNRTHVLGPLGIFIEIEFEDVALAQALELFYFVMITSDQAALYAQVADGALQLAFGAFQVGFGSIGFGFGSAEFGGHLAKFRGSVGLYCAFLMD
jgi:hypothetical protein